VGSRKPSTCPARPPPPRSPPDWPGHCWIWTGIKDTDKLIKERFRIHPQAEIIEFLPGLGPLLGTEFLVTTRRQLSRR
jgi:hypothetical protein